MQQELTQTPPPKIQSTLTKQTLTEQQQLQALANIVNAPQTVESQYEQQLRKIVYQPQTTTVAPSAKPKASRFSRRSRLKLGSRTQPYPLPPELKQFQLLKYTSNVLLCVVIVVLMIFLLQY